MWIAAVFMAAKSGIESWPAAMRAFPLVTDWGWLNFVPLVLLTLAATREMTRPREMPQRLHPREMSQEFQSASDLANKVIQASTELAASRPKMPDPSAPKEFLPDSFAKRYMDAVNVRRTDLQIDALLRPHLNKWIRFEVIMEQVRKRGDGVEAMLSDPSTESAREFWILFHPVWSTHLAQVEKGEVIKLAVQIVDVGYEIRLMNAELL